MHIYVAMCRRAHTHKYIYIFLFACNMSGIFLGKPVLTLFLIGCNTFHPISVLQLSKLEMGVSKWVLQWNSLFQCDLRTKGNPHCGAFLGPSWYIVTTQRYPLEIVSLGLRMKLFTTKCPVLLPFLTCMVLSGHLFLESYLFSFLSPLLKFIS